MTLSDLASIGNFVNGLAVLTSLVFVGFQIHKNTLATQAASHNAVSDGLNKFNFMFAESAEVTKLWLDGLRDRRALAPPERWRFDSMLRVYLHVCETMYVQADLGAGDREIMAAEENGIRVVFSSPSVREWWADNPYGFSSRFRDYVEKLWD